MNIKTNSNAIVNASDILPFDVDYITECYSMDYAELKNSICVNGIIDPIKVAFKNGQWFCANGYRCLQIAKELENENNWQHGDIQAVDITPKETDNLHLEFTYTSSQFLSNTFSNS